MNRLSMKNTNPNIMGKGRQARTLKHPAMKQRVS